jgi:hypothetical protein
MPRALIELISQETPEHYSAEFRALRDSLLQQYEGSVDAMLIYGSCLRSGDALDGLVDLYLVVDDYYKAYRRRIPALFNRLLPPNVYYLEVPVGGKLVRSKYAVVSMEDLERGTSSKWFSSYLWGRFSQPCGLLYSRNPEQTGRVHSVLAQAVLTFLNRVLPSLPGELETREIWHQGLALSYRSELRAEKPERGMHIYESWEGLYQKITETAMPMVGYPVDTARDRSPTRYLVRIDARTRQLNRWGWLLRRIQGKLLTVLRLMKSAFTFQGGIDYIAWKLERHTGVPVHITPRMRRHPLIYSWGLVWRLYRRGVFR